MTEDGRSIFYSPIGHNIHLHSPLSTRWFTICIGTVATKVSRVRAALQPYKPGYSSLTPIDQVPGLTRVKLTRPSATSYRICKVDQVGAYETPPACGHLVLAIVDHKHVSHSASFRTATVREYPWPCEPSNKRVRRAGPPGPRSNPGRPPCRLRFNTATATYLLNAQKIPDKQISKSALNLHRLRSITSFGHPTK